MKKAVRVKKHTKKKVSYPIVFLILSCVVIALLFAVKTYTQLVVDAQFLSDARYRYDERRSGLSGSIDLITPPARITPGAVAPPQPKWQLKCPGGIGSSLPAVTKDTVYIYCYGTPQTQGLYAFNIDPVIDPTTKQPTPRWKNTLTDSRLCGNSAGTFSSALEVVGNVIYFNVCLKTVAINSNGTYKWSYTHQQFYAPSSVSPPIAAAGRVYISTSKGATPYDSQLIAVPANASGPINATNALWITSSKDTVPGTFPGVWTQEMTAGLDGKTIFVVGNSSTGLIDGKGYIWMMNGDTGKIKDGWPITVSFSKGQQFYEPSSLRDGNVYVGASTGMVSAYDKNDPRGSGGNPVWSYKAPTYVSHRITLGKKLAVFADTAGTLYAIDNDKDSAKYGQVKWQKNYNNNLPGAGSTPNATMTNNSKGVVYIGNYQGEVKAFMTDTSPNPIWSLKVYDTDPKVIRDVVVIDGRVYVKNDAGLLKVYKNP